jgi:hypothetical protein
LPPEGFRSTGFENVSVKRSVRFKRSEKSTMTQWERTIEKRIGDKATGIDSSVVYGSEGLAITSIKGAYTDGCTL